MRDRVSGHVERYKKEFSEKDIFWTDDYFKIAELSGCEVRNETVYNLISNAVKFAFIVGYNRAVIETKKRNK